MWLLALLGAGLSDAVEARAHRRTTHELSRRLFTVPERTPTLSEIILAFYDQFPMEDPSWDAWIHAVDLITALLEAAIGDRNWNENLQCRLLRPAPEDVGRLPRGGRTWIPIPRGDLSEVRSGRSRKASFQPVTRTSRDVLVQIVLDAYRAGSEFPFVSESVIPMIEALPSVHDWIDATSPSLRGMDWDAVHRASRAWHQQFASSVVDRSGPPPTALVLLRWPDGWTLQRLLTKKDFAAEGAAMQHCVGGPDRGDGLRNGESAYWQDARDNRSAILSLRDDKGVPTATIEMQRRNYIAQVQGPFDEEPSEAAMAHLQEAALKLDWWEGFPSRALSRLGRSPVWTDARLEKETAPAVLRAMSMEPDEFPKEGSELLARAVHLMGHPANEAAKKGNIFVSTPPLDTTGAPLSGRVVARVVDLEYRVLSWVIDNGVSTWIVQESVDAPGTRFAHPYDALRAFTKTYAEPPIEKLAAIEAMPGLPGKDVASAIAAPLEVASEMWKRQVR